MISRVFVCTDGGPRFPEAPTHRWPARGFSSYGGTRVTGSTPIYNGGASVTLLIPSICVDAGDNPLHATASFSGVPHAVADVPQDRRHQEGEGALSAQSKPMTRPRVVAARTQQPSFAGGAFVNHCHTPHFPVFTCNTCRHCESAGTLFPLLCWNTHCEGSPISKSDLGCARRCSAVGVLTPSEMSFALQQKASQSAAESSEWVCSAAVSPVRATVIGLARAAGFCRPMKEVSPVL